MKMRLLMRFLLFIPLLFFVPSTRGGVPQMDQSNWVSLKNGGEVGRYFRKKDIIYVHVNGMVQQALKNADVTSFKVNKIHSDYARDKNNIWFVSEIKKVDTATWVILDSSYCLLYTSPSPRDQRGSRMPSSA